MKPTVFSIYALVFMLLSDVLLFAQDDMPTDDGFGDLQDEDLPNAPINGKIIWLTVLGLFYAWYSLRKRQKNGILRD